MLQSSRLFQVRSGLRVELGIKSEMVSRPGRGFTLIELLVVMAIIALLIGILLPALGAAKRAMILAKDGTQIREIHQSWLISAREHDGYLPTPGLIFRQDVDGVYEPGRGKEHKLRNTTNNVHSACIMAGYYTPEICVSAAEVSSQVAIKDTYNHELYNVAHPTNPIYWDPSFAANLHGLSNLSYASLPVAGARQTKHWRETSDSAMPMIGNRGVKNGSLDSDDYNNSITLEIHGGKREWLGNICFNDNHIATTRTFKPDNVQFAINGQMQPDNIFRNDVPGGSPTNPSGDDSWLVIVGQNGLAGTADNVAALLCQWD